MLLNKSYQFADSWTETTHEDVDNHQLYLNLIGQEGEDLLGGGAQDGPAVVGGVWEGQGLSESLQQGPAEGQALSSATLLELLQAEALHVDLELVLSHVLHPQAQVLVQVTPCLVLHKKYFL